jgi:hypothetical protein
VLLRDGVKIGMTALATHGVLSGSTAESVAGALIAGGAQAWSTWRSTPDNILERAAKHPDPAAAALVQDALQKRAAGNGSPQI